MSCVFVSFRSNGLLHPQAKQSVPTDRVCFTHQFSSSLIQSARDYSYCLMNGDMYSRDHVRDNITQIPELHKYRYLVWVDEGIEIQDPYFVQRCIDSGEKMISKEEGRIIFHDKM